MSDVKALSSNVPYTHITAVDIREQRENPVQRLLLKRVSSHHIPAHNTGHHHTSANSMGNCCPHSLKTVPGSGAPTQKHSRGKKSVLMQERGCKEPRSNGGKDPPWQSTTTLPAPVRCLQLSLWGHFNSVLVPQQSPGQVTREDGLSTGLRAGRSCARS